MNAVLRVYRSRDLLWNLTLRELRTKYRRSFLGWTWSMLNPLATVAIYGYVFGVLFDSPVTTGDPSGVRSFALFMLCGLLPWNFFKLTNDLGLQAISLNAGLVRRVAFPREVLVFANVLHACVQFSIEMCLLFVVLLIAGSPLLPWIPLTVVMALFLAMFGSGFALALGALAVYFRDMTYLWLIALQVWFFATPIVYSPDLVDTEAPEWMKPILQANPMAGFAEVFRAMLYDARAPDLLQCLALAVASAATLALGWAVFLRLSRRMPEEV
jgi:ABC-2 type transport system permease protein